MTLAVKTTNLFWSYYFNKIHSNVKKCSRHVFCIFFFWPYDSHRLQMLKKFPFIETNFSCAFGCQKGTLFSRKLSFPSRQLMLAFPSIFCCCWLKRYLYRFCLNLYSVATHSKQGHFYKRANSPTSLNKECLQ